MKLVVCALIVWLSFSMGSAHAEQLQCRLNGQSSMINLNLQPPKVIHQVAGQAALSVVGKANNQGVLSYTLPNKASYQLNRNTLGYTQVLNNKTMQGRCQVMASKPKTNYVCGKKFYCKQMQSCEEATYYMNHCGLSRLDSDHDGSPCENVCGD